MKRICLLFLLAASLALTSCATAATTSTPPPSESTQPLAATKGPTTLSSETEALAATLPAEPESTPPPENGVQWDTDGETLVVRVTNCCGFVPELVVTNYIPEAQVWGGGRILWVQQEASGQRHVFEGQLSQEQLSTLLQSAASQGFFQWQELYTEPNSPTDMASKCIEIRLKEQSRQVCEYFSGAPQAFHDMFDNLSRGAGAVGKDYIPERIYLKAFRQPAGNLPGAPVWDPQVVAFSLDNALEGAWVEGPALLRAWELVNTNLGGPVVQEGDSLYQLSAQIPGVSLAETPAQP